MKENPALAGGRTDRTHWTTSDWCRFRLTCWFKVNLFVVVAVAPLVVGADVVDFVPANVDFRVNEPLRAAVLALSVVVVGPVKGVRHSSRSKRTQEKRTTVRWFKR